MFIYAVLNENMLWIQALNVLVKLLFKCNTVFKTTILATLITSHWDFQFLGESKVSSRKLSEITQTLPNIRKEMW